MCLGGADTAAGPGALIRGANFLVGANAGVFAVIGLYLPSIADYDIGFRCGR